MSNNGIPKKVKLQMIFWALFMPVILIISIIFFLPEKKDELLTMQEKQDIRLQPVGRVAEETEAEAKPEVKPETAETKPEVKPEAKPETTEVVEAVKEFDVKAAYVTCNACHGTNFPGAPQKGDAAEWKKRFEALGGIDGVVASAIKGKGVMPPKGGATLSDADFTTLVKYLSDTK